MLAYARAAGAGRTGAGCAGTGSGTPAAATGRREMKRAARADRNAFAFGTPPRGAGRRKGIAASAAPTASPHCAVLRQDRKRVVSGTRDALRVAHAGRPHIK